MIRQATGGGRWALGVVRLIPDPLFLIPVLRRGSLAVVLTTMFAAFASAQMPDLTQMSGIPRPVDDLPNGSVSIRVVRGDFAHPVVDHPVQMTAGGRTRSANTDAEGRAQFDGIAPGTDVQFSTEVDGQHLESQAFAIQPQGGIRLLLVATGNGAAGGSSSTPAAPATPAVPGTVVIGGESRIVVEPDEETVSVYYIIDIVNGASTPVMPQQPFVFTLPSAATSTTVIQGSSPLASNRGREVTVVGPFPPGTTAIQVFASYPATTGTVEITQAFPAAVDQLVVIAKKAGDMKLASPQFSRVEETVIEGTPVVLGMGGQLAAGTPMALTITGLPHHSGTPRTIALTLAGLIALVGLWAATRNASGGADRAAEHTRLISRREKLLQDLVRLEHDHRRGKIDGPRYADRREDLMQSLEHVYGALDEDGAGPEPAKRPGVAA